MFGRKDKSVDPENLPGLNRLYDEWINNIVEDCRANPRGLLDHIIHHAEEGLQEGVTGTWFASIENLIEIMKRIYDQRSISVHTKLERLYQHWIQDPKNMTPPPQLASFNKMIQLETRKQREREDTFSGSGGS